MISVRSVDVVFACCHRLGFSVEHASTQQFPFDRLFTSLEVENLAICKYLLGLKMENTYFNAAFNFLLKLWIFRKKGNL